MNRRGRFISEEDNAQILIIGVGGAGTKFVDFLSKRDLGVKCKFLAIDTDVKSLKRIGENVEKIQIGAAICGGLGAMGSPTIGRKAAILHRDEIEGYLNDVQIAFIVAGLGRGTGTGAAPILSQIVKKKDALNFAIAIYPFKSETGRLEIARGGIKTLRETTNTLLISDNNALIKLFPKYPLEEALKLGDEVSFNTIRGLLNIALSRGTVPISKIDLKSALSVEGYCFSLNMTASTLSSSDEIKEALINNLCEQLEILDLRKLLKSIKGLMVYIEGGRDMSFNDIKCIQDGLSTFVTCEEESIFMGYELNSQQTGEVKVTVIFTGVPNNFLDIVEEQK